MIIARDAIPQIVFNVLILVVFGCWLAPRAFRGKKNRAVVVAMMAMAAFGLCVNLTGHTIDGFLQGGQIHDVR